MKYSFNQLLQEIANGKRQITIKFPELDTPIKAIITDINLINPDWKPFKVNIITKGLQIKDYRWVEKDFIGEVKEEYQRPYTEDWIKVEFITDIDFEEGQQIEMPLQRDINQPKTKDGYSNWIRNNALRLWYSYAYSNTFYC